MSSAAASAIMSRPELPTSSTDATKNAGNDGENVVHNDHVRVSIVIKRDTPQFSHRCGSWTPIPHGASHIFDVSNKMKANAIANPIPAAITDGVPTDMVRVPMVIQNDDKPTFSHERGPWTPVPPGIHTLFPPSQPLAPPETPPSAPAAVPTNATRVTKSATSPTKK